MKKIFLLLITMLFITDVSATEVATEAVSEGLKYIDCGGFKVPHGVAYIINTIVNLAYIGVPLGIIITGSGGFIKSIMANDKKGIAAFKPIFIEKLKAGAIAFIAFTIVKLLVSFVSDAASNNINQCLECLINDKTCGGVIASPNKVEIPKDQEFFLPDANEGITLDLDAYKKGLETIEEAERIRDPNYKPEDDEEKEDKKKDDSDSDTDSNSDESGDNDSESGDEEAPVLDHNGVPFSTTVEPND